MKLKNAGFKHKWEAVKYIEEGGKVYGGDGEIMSIYSVSGYPADSVQIEDKPTWQEECIEHRYPCWFWDRPEEEGLVVSTLTRFKEESVYPYDTNDDFYVYCRPVKPSECYQGESDEQYRRSGNL